MLALTTERDGGFRMLRKLLFCLAMLVVAGPAAADDAMRCSAKTGDVDDRGLHAGNQLGRGATFSKLPQPGRTPTASKATRTVPLPTSPRRYG